MITNILFLLSLSHASEKCIGNDIEVTDSTWDIYVNKSIPVVIRMYFTGCVYAEPSNKAWADAAKQYEDVIFLKADCINGARQICNKLQFEIGQLDTLLSPVHFFYHPNPDGSRPPKKGDLDTQQINVTLGANHFIDEIKRRFGKDPIRSPMSRLDTFSTDSFLNRTDFSSILFYSSSNFSQIDFVSRPMGSVTSETIDTEKVSLGVLDCCRYPEECRRWTGNDSPDLSSLVYSKTTSRTVIKHSLAEDVNRYTSSILAAIDYVSSNPTPQKTPYPVKPVDPTPPGFKPAKTTVKSKLESRSEEEVRNIFKEYGQLLNLNPIDYQFGEGGSTSCKTGTYNNDARKWAFLSINFFRKLSGVSPVAKQNDEFNTGLDSLAVTLGQQGTVPLDHDVSEFRCVKTSATTAPKDIVIKYGKDSNLGMGAESPHKAVENLVRDWGDHNKEVGHRYNILYPAYNISASSGFWIGGKRASNADRYFPGFTAVMLEKPKSLTGNEPWYSTLPEFIAYPCPGPFPIQVAQITERWSVISPLFENLNSANDVEVIVVGSDGSSISVKEVTFNKGYTSKHRLISFEIEKQDMQLFVPGYSVEVQVFIKSTQTEIRYKSEFFDPSVEVSSSVCVHNGDSSKCPSDSQQIRASDLSKQSFTGEVSMISTNSNNDIRLPHGTYSVTINGPLKAIYVPVNVTAKVIDAEEVGLYIHYSPEEIPKFGRAEFTKKPGFIKIEFDSNPVPSELIASSTVYQGPLCNVFFPEKTSYEFPRGVVDLSYEFYRTNTVPNELNIKRFLQSYVAEFCDSDLGVVSLNEQQLPYSFFGGGLTAVNIPKKVKTIRLRSAFNGGDEYLLDSTLFPEGRYHYEFVLSFGVPSMKISYRHKGDYTNITNIENKILSATFEKYNGEILQISGFDSSEFSSYAVPAVFSMKFIFKNAQFTEPGTGISKTLIYLTDYDVDPSQEANLRKHFYKQNVVSPTDDCVYNLRRSSNRAQYQTIIIENKCVQDGFVKLDWEYSEEVPNTKYNFIPYNKEVLNVKFRLINNFPDDHLFFYWSLFGFHNVELHSKRASLSQIQFRLYTFTYNVKSANIFIEEKTNNFIQFEVIFYKMLPYTQVGCTIGNDPNFFATIEYFKSDNSQPKQSVEINSLSGESARVSNVDTPSVTVSEVKECIIENVKTKSIDSIGTSLQILNSDLSQTTVTLKRNGFGFPTIMSKGSMAPKSLTVHYSSSSLSYLSSNDIEYKAITDIDSDKIDSWFDATQELQGVPEGITSRKQKNNDNSISFILSYNNVVESLPEVTPDPDYKPPVIPSDDEESDGDDNNTDNGGDSDGDDNNTDNGGDSEQSETPGGNQTSSGISGGGIAGIIIAVLLAVGASVGAAYYFVIHKNGHTLTSWISSITSKDTDLYDSNIHSSTISNSNEVEGVEVEIDSRDNIPNI